MKPSPAVGSLTLHACLLASHSLIRLLKQRPTGSGLQANHSRALVTDSDWHALSDGTPLQHAWARCDPDGSELERQWDECFEASELMERQLRLLQVDT